MRKIARLNDNRQGWRPLDRPNAVPNPRPISPAKVRNGAECQRSFSQINPTANAHAKGAARRVPFVACPIQNAPQTSITGKNACAPCMTRRKPTLAAALNMVLRRPRGPIGRQAAGWTTAGVTAWDDSGGGEDDKVGLVDGEPLLLLLPLRLCGAAAVQGRSLAVGMVRLALPVLLLRSP